MIIELVMNKQQVIPFINYKPVEVVLCICPKALGSSRPPSDAIWWQYWLTMAQIMACCLTAPSHSPNQFQLEIIGIHSSAISQKICKICWQKSSSDIKFLNMFVHQPGDNKFINTLLSCLQVIRQTTNISHTKSQNLNVSHRIVQFSLSNPLKPGVKSRMNM